MPNAWQRGGVPPEDVAARVRQVMGDEVWNQLSERWDRVLAVDPKARLTQWYRNPEQIRAEYLTNRAAAWATLHGVGLAVDVTPTAALRQRFIDAARREAFHVRTYPAPDPHLHVAALSPREWVRSPLRRWLLDRLGPRPPR